MGIFQRRLFKNLLIDRDFQVKFALYFVGFTVAITSLMIAAVSYVIQVFTTEVSDINISELEFQTKLSDLVININSIGVMVLFVISVFSFGFAVFVTHRVSGAAKKIENYLLELSTGKYDSTPVLRKSDDLQKLMAAARKVGDHLKSKNST